MKRCVWLGLFLLLAIALGRAYAHARAQLPALQGQAALYASPEEAMRTHVVASYNGLRGEEIVLVGQHMPLLRNLWFVEARVWACSRRDGKPAPAAGDNPGCFFLHLPEGWVLVPESRHPELLAVALRLFRAGSF
jgi:hypothetical protein